MSYLWNKTAVFFLFLLIMGLYLFGATQQATTLNLDLSSNDQEAYMHYASSLATSGYTFIGDRNRMPIYPLFQSLFYRPHLTNEAFFTQGKYVNIALSLFLLTSLAAVFYKHLSKLEALNILLISAFTVFIFKAGYIQVELLFYTFSFMLFLLFRQSLQTPSWQLACLTGFTAGLTHLTKASISPALALFIVLATLQLAVNIWQLQQTQSPILTNRLVRRQIGSIVLTIVIFLLTVAPYIITSKQIFGHYFYNVNSTFYIWYDSWGEATQGTKAHGDRVGWPTMPAEEIPSMSKYLEEHTTAQIIGRIQNGSQTTWQNMRQSYGYFKYIVLYLSLFVMALFINRSTLYETIKGNLFTVLFVVGYFIGYWLLYAWYVPIASGNRFVLALFLPLLFTLAQTIHYSWPPTSVTIMNTQLSLRNLANLLILCLVVGDIYFILTARIFVIFGGR